MPTILNPSEAKDELMSDDVTSPFNDFSTPPPKEKLISLTLPPKKSETGLV